MNGTSVRGLCHVRSTVLRSDGSTEWVMVFEPCPREELAQRISHHTRKGELLETYHGVRTIQS
jgi:hypothetical protein